MKKVTILVGEVGCGKSILLENLAGKEKVILFHPRRKYPLVDTLFIDGVYSLKNKDDKGASELMNRTGTSNLIITTQDEALAEEFTKILPWQDVFVIHLNQK